MGWRVIWKLSQRVRKHGGWSFGLYNLAASLQDAKNQADRLQTKLMKLHGPDTYLDSISIRSLDTRRLAFKKLFTDITGKAYTTDDRSDYPTTCVLLKMSNTETGAYVQQSIRGIPDSTTDNGGFYKPKPAYIRAVDDFVSQLCDSGDPWELRINNPANPVTHITGVSDTGVITANAHGLSNGELVRVSGVTGATWVNRQDRVVSATSNTFALAKAVPPSPAPAYTGGGTVQLKTPLFVGISACEVAGVSEHRVGRPSEVLIGRRSTRRR